jgi:hypothetical protein
MRRSSKPIPKRMGPQLPFSREGLASYIDSMEARHDNIIKIIHDPNQRLIALNNFDKEIERQREGIENQPDVAGKAELLERFDRQVEKIRPRLEEAKRLSVGRGRRRKTMRRRKARKF